MPRTKKNSYEDYDSPFASRLRDLLAVPGMNQSKLADSIGVTRQAVSAYSLGVSLPDIEKLGKIADFFGVSTEFLKNSADFSEIEAIYAEIVGKKKAAKRKRAMLLIIPLGVGLLLILLPILLLSGGGSTEKKLERLVEQVQVCIVNEDYVTARIKASQIVDDSEWSSSASTKKWDNVRISLLAQIDALEGKPPTQTQPESTTETTTEVTTESTTSAPTIRLPASGAELDLGNYQDAVTQLEQAGFTDIELIPLGDLKIALLHNEGDVESISVNGISGFAAGTEYSLDDQPKIIIRYHSYP
jgi:transcriptional regulator with XRE-family HTH domain